MARVVICDRCKKQTTDYSELSIVDIAALGSSDVTPLWQFCASCLKDLRGWVREGLGK